eukprot:g35878.t1
MFGLGPSHEPPRRVLWTPPEDCSSADCVLLRDTLCEPIKGITALDCPSWVETAYSAGTPEEFRAPDIPLRK